MKITYGPDTLDTSTLLTPEDVLTFAQNIKGQSVSLFPTAKERPRRKGDILFDKCTDKEIALRNLVWVMEAEYNKIAEKLFPVAVSNLMALAKQSGQESIVALPPVDTEEYAEFQKLAYIKGLLTQYTSFLIQARIGFGLSLSVTNNGQIHVLQDLRELHS